MNLPGFGRPPRQQSTATPEARGLSRRRFLRRSTLAASAVWATSVSRHLGAADRADRSRQDVVSPDSLTFLRELATATVESARIRPGQSRAGMGPNATGIAVISPGGNYPALWTRDFAMSLDCGLIGAADIRSHLRLIAQAQNGEQARPLASGATIPPFAIVDHINLAGGAVFYPGTYSAGEDQGAAPWGPLPPMDDHFYFIHIAYALWRDTRETAFLYEPIAGVRLVERLTKAFESPAADPQTGAAVAKPESRAVGFGFQDSVHLLGALSFATLLRLRAARQLAALHEATGDVRAATTCRQEAGRIAAHLVPTFADPARRDGWLLAATETGRQPDVWATLFALHLKALPEDAAVRARQTVIEAVRAPGHPIEYQGAVRHVSSDRYFRPDQCWERGGSRANTYQSGAFWHTATGWLIEALHQEDPELARAVCDRYLRHLREQDFRLGGERRAPWECFGLDLADAQNPIYLTSVTLPLAILESLGNLHQQA